MMHRMVVWVSAGLLLLLAAGLIGLKSGWSGEVTRDSRPESASTEGRPAGNQGDNRGNAQRLATPRPPQKPKVTILGEKVTLVEGRLGETGSEGPVKLKKRDGSIISASRLKLAEGDDVHLVAPLSIQAASGHVLSMKEGVMTMSKDGVFKSQGSVEMRGEVDEVQGQRSAQEGEP